MTILSGDIKLLASKIMDDVPNGGGGPTGNAIPDGASNAIFSDVTERQRAVGGVSIRQLFGAVQTPTTDAYMDPTVVLSQMPNDPNVSITLAKTSMFARRTEMANAIENYLIKSSEWGGYLLENHVAGQRSIQIIQRPGMPTPAIGRTLVLVQSEGLPAQVMQYVRITKVEVTQRTFTYQSGNGLVDYVADVLDCTLSDVLRSNFAGSPPSRYYTRDPAKTVVRDTTVADAATFYGAAALSTLGSIGDSLLRVSSVYTQLVPSARTESAALDQKPAAQRTLTLAQSPRLIEVGITPHTMRIRVGQENRGFSWVQMLKPRPAPGTVVISYMALGNWYTLVDDGLGGFTGSGVGQVIYTTGSLSITLPSIPDAGTSIIFQWGENTAYTSRAGQAGYRAPEFAWALPQSPVRPGSVVVTWLSGGVLKTATDNGTGGLTSADATGEINYALGKIYLRPTAMLDAGGEFQTAFEYSTTRTENFTGVAVDAGGFAAITLAESPAPRSVSIDWVTVRNVTDSAGASDFVSASSVEKSPTYKTVTETVYETVRPPPPPPPPIPQKQQITTLESNAQKISPLGVITLRLHTGESVGDGSIDWAIQRIEGAALADAFADVTGTVQVSGNLGFFDVRPKAALGADFTFTVSVTKAGGPPLASSGNLLVDVEEPAPPPPKVTYSSNYLQGLGGELYALEAGTSRAMTFTGPVPDGAYNWKILAANGVQSFSSVSGSFQVTDGIGGFWVRSEAAVPATKFYVEVQKLDGVTLARTTEVQLHVDGPSPGWQPPPPTVIKVRDPLTTGSAMTSSGASAIAGMYAAGMDADGKSVFVAVPPTDSDQWGMTYNPPQDWDAVWTAADIAAKTKTLTSAQGAQVAYRIWGA